MLPRARRVLDVEAHALTCIRDRLDARFTRALDLLLACRGKVVVTGVGKSGIVCRKIAATLASTGTPAFFLHAADGNHGDAGTLVRGDVLSVRENAYVEAARALGCWPTRVALRHVLPNVVAPIIVISTVAIAWSIILGASLSFLGLGPRPPIPEWGIDLSSGRNYLLRAWWISSVPGFCIMLTVVAVNLVGDALRDELDPRLRSLANL